MRPKIAVTKSARKNRISVFCLGITLRLMGATPVFVSPDMDYNAITFDGLIISGGIDIHPKRYDSREIKDNYKYDLARDDMEFALLRIAEERNLPVLGICRGGQLMNIYRGGTLHFDVSKAYERASYPSNVLARIFYRKRMYIDDKSSLIYRLLKCDSCKVNSIHTQSIDKLGDHLQIKGQEKNGVVQSIEDPSRAFFLGVQFHPEYLVYSPIYRRVFKGLISTARNKKGA